MWGLCLERVAWIAAFARKSNCLRQPKVCFGWTRNCVGVSARLSKPRSSDDASITYRRLFASSAGLVLVLASGCQPEVPQVATLPNQPVQTRRAEPVQSVVVDPTIAQSPAASGSSIEALASSPQAVCRAFLQRLQSGDRLGAEALLTREALMTTTRANLMLEPITTPTSSVVVQPAVFKTHLHDIAEVECRIADQNEDHASESKITWQVRKQAGGWRISGMCVPLRYDAPNQLLSFESIDDVATIKLLATGEAIQNSQDARQAEARDRRTTLQ